jgi:hypothetical protein
VSIASDAARFLFQKDASIHRVLLFVATFSVLASMGRSTVLLLLEVFARRQLARNTPRIFQDLWRATTVMTLEHVEVSLPNAMLARAAIRNHSRPSAVSRRRIVVAVAYAAPPATVQEALLGALAGVPGVLPSPPPCARTRSFADSSIEYELLFFIDDFGEAANIEGTARDRIYHSLAKGAIDARFVAGKA